MPNITINGKKYEVESGLTVIQVCDNLGIQIPRFCYHEKLPCVGSCRMCLVELKGSPKLVSACTTSITDGMEVNTETPSIDSGRKTMLELLLTNHPLDCPICDKAGECDLQDQSYRYGFDRSSFTVEKRAVKQKDFGPLIDPYMTRCILCTRCVRFATEVAGVEELGAIGRGDLTEINTYIEKILTSELSGNIADICPVGALTHADYAYKARPWELISTESIDIIDAVGSNIKIDCSPLAVLRIMPKLNEDINEEWLADKSRYIVDALRKQRLDTPMLRINGKLENVTWEKALNTIAEKMLQLSKEEIAVLSGNFVDLESLYAMKTLMQSLNIENIECRVNDIAFNPEDNGSYVFNTTISGIEDSDLCLIIGSNPRKEAPIINARIRKRYLDGGYNIAVIGEHTDLNYKYAYLGENSIVLQQILDGTHEYCKTIKDAKKPMLIIGLEALVQEGADNIINLCKQISQKYGFVKDDWNGFNVLQVSASLTGALDLGFVQKDYTKTAKDILNKVASNAIKMLWLMNVDNIDFTKISKDTFVIYQGHHGDKGASVATVILPSALWVEQDATYVNTEGRIQRSYKAIPTLGEAKESWKIIRSLSTYLNKELSFNNLTQLRESLFQNYPIFARLGLSSRKYISSDKSFVIQGKPMFSVIDNYYITDIISANSNKMAECSKLFKNK